MCASGKGCSLPDMASAAPRAPLDRLRTEPLRGLPLAIAVLIVWLAGAVYCSGYEKLLWGIDNWPGSLGWSAVAVLPWFALVEWSKSASGRRLSEPLGNLALLLVGTGILSVSLELALDALTGATSRPVSLLLLRRLPAIGVCFVLILWARGAQQDQDRATEAEGEALVDIAASIDWIEAADNYVELHIDGRTSMRRMTMRDAERALAPLGFLRVHRRFLVNGERIRSVHLNGRRTVELSSGEALPVGRAFAPNVALHANPFATWPQKR